MSDELAPIVEVLPAGVEALRGRAMSGACRIRLAGLVEDAVVLEVLDVDKRGVRIRMRIGDDPWEERWYRRGDVIRCNLAVRSTGVGL